MKIVVLCCFSIFVAVFTAPADITEAEQDHELSGGFFQGDMEINIARNGLIEESKYWPNNLVHYKIDKMFDEDHASYILTAMQMIEEVSCIHFAAATSATRDYIHFIGKRTGCHSKVGFQGDLQTLNLQIDALETGCFQLGTVVHEILHALGFHHQQSAADRDEYVLIVEKNIQKGKKHNFMKYDDDTVTDFGVEYDYGSLLHYSATAFSKNGKPTIVPRLNESIEIGQRRAMSPADIEKLNLMYKCKRAF